MVINFENLKYTDKYTDKWKKFECLCAYRQLDSLFLDSGIFEYRIELLAKKNIWVSMWVAAPLIGGSGTHLVTFEIHPSLDISPNGVNAPDPSTIGGCAWSATTL